MPSTPPYFLPLFFFLLVPPFPLSFSNLDDEDANEPREKIITASKTTRGFARLREEQLSSKGSWFPPRRPRAAYVPTPLPTFEIAHGTVWDFHHPPRVRHGRVGRGGRPRLRRHSLHQRRKWHGEKRGVFWTHAQSKHPGREQPSFARGRGMAGSHRVGYTSARGGAGMLSPRITRRLYQHGWPGPPATLSYSTGVQKASRVPRRDQNH